MASYINRLDRDRFQLVHGDTVYVQGCFDHDEMEKLFLGAAMSYPPCWAALDPGMEVQPHQHPIPEFYIFTGGFGEMRIDDDTFDVCKDTAVYIPPDAVHTVVNPSDAEETLVWLSIGLKAEQ